MKKSSAVVFLLALAMTSACEPKSESIVNGQGPILTEHHLLLVPPDAELPEGFKRLGDTGAGKEEYEVQFSWSGEEGEKDYLNAKIEFFGSLHGAGVTYKIRDTQAVKTRFDLKEEVEGIGDIAFQIGGDRPEVVFLRANGIVTVIGETSPPRVRILARHIDQRIIEEQAKLPPAP